MEKWEYLTMFLEASTKSKEVKEFVKETFKEKKPKKYAPESMIPKLNVLGEVGWELVHMEPVADVGNNADVLFDNGQWSNEYFCVFKRLKNPPQEVQSIKEVLGQGEKKPEAQGFNLFPPSIPPDLGEH